uniref:NADH-ubiquinone oxidoreductase chain 5 n=1 Tax=Brachycerus muricatus TaxID=159793 RepID=J9PHX3_9CUCU|nr:NADH dehydrogenase subunit 5 [Brachycerus muricatus]
MTTKKGYKTFGYIYLLMSMVLFFLGLYYLSTDKNYMFEYSLLNLNSMSMSFTVFISWMSMLFMSLVFYISSMVMFYSSNYMEDNKYPVRFILLIMMFIMSMSFLILISNLITILLGWDGLGLTSYLLVVFYQNSKSSNAGMTTLLVNRIGDVALILAIGLMFNYGGWNWDYYIEFFHRSNYTRFICVMIILAALTKSAQIPFSPWLVAAMAAPTPVSALVHSSTLVTAGVYLLIRFSHLYSPDHMSILLFISLLTGIMSGMAAVFEFDLKKIVALSTLSQLSLMVSILALGEKELAFFYLLIHALLKALLFMCVGAIIHSMDGFQDIRLMGGLAFCMPITCSFMTISNLSLCGVPFLAGFYSKDLMVEVSMSKPLNLMVVASFYFIVSLTVCYSVRLVYYLMIKESSYLCFSNVSEKLSPMHYSMFGLIFYAAFSGSMMSWLIFVTPYFTNLPEQQKSSIILTIGLSLWFSLLFSQVGFFSLINTLLLTKLFYIFGLWNLPVLISYGMNIPISNLGDLFISAIEQGWFEYYGSLNLSLKWKDLSKFLQILSKNHVVIYTGLVILWVLILLLV